MISKLSSKQSPSTTTGSSFGATGFGIADGLASGLLVALVVFFVAAFTKVAFLAKASFLATIACQKIRVGKKKKKILSQIQYNTMLIRLLSK